MNKIVRFAISLGAFTAFSVSPLFAQTNDNQFKILAPSEGQTLYGTKVPVLISLPQGYTFSDFEVNKAVATGQVHLHLWLDDTNPTKESAIKIKEEDFTYSDVPNGDHILTAELVNNDHSSLKPPQIQRVNFKTDQASSPSPIAASGFDKNTAVVILVVVALVILAAWWYTKEDVDEEVKSQSEKSKSKSSRKKTSKRRK